MKLPPVGINQNAAPNAGELRVGRSVASLGGKLTYIDPKTQGSRRNVPITPATTTLLREYLAVHPDRENPDSPLFPAITLLRSRVQTLTHNQRVRGGARVTQESESASTQQKAHRQAAALARLTVDEAEARLSLDWSEPLRHATFCKAVYRPAVLRANRLAGGPIVAPQLTLHALRHTYASICVAAGLDYMQVCRFMGHAKPTTALSIYTHLFNTDDHSGAMAALGAMAATSPDFGENVVPLWGAR